MRVGQQARGYVKPKPVDPRHPNQNKWQQTYRTKLRAWLFAQLGGEQCTWCGSTHAVEIDHVDGKTWRSSKLSSTARWARYVQEYKQGVRLRPLCKSCNSGHLNNSWREDHGRAEVRCGSSREPGDDEHEEADSICPPPHQAQGTGGSSEGSSVGEPESRGVRSVLRNARSEGSLAARADDGVGSVPF